MKAAVPERILLVEDDERMVKLLRALLELSEFQIFVASSGDAAVNRAMEIQPNLVILDLLLPDMSGYEVCRRLRRSFQPWTLPILMLTGLDQPVDQLRGFAFGADAYLTKPTRPEELIKTVKLLLGHPDPELSATG